MGTKHESLTYEGKKESMDAIRMPAGEIAKIQQQLYRYAKHNN